jgi:hypothetical protein
MARMVYVVPMHRAVTGMLHRLTLSTAIPIMVSVIRMWPNV